jgi:hypothetical protein
MGDSVPSQSKGLLKRQRSATFTPGSDVFGDNDFVPSFMSAGGGFGAVFANELIDNPIEDDGVGSNGSNFGRGNWQPREPPNEFDAWNPELIPRTRTQEAIIEAINNDGLLDYVPSLTPRVRPDPSGRTPRSRQDLSKIDDVQLVLVGTTLVAKTANEQLKLDVRFLFGIALSVPLEAAPSFPPLERSRAQLQMEALSSNLDKHTKNFPNLELTYPG